MDYFLIILAAVLIFLLLLLLLTGCKLSNLVGFFVEELDENNTPLHPVRLMLRPKAAEPAPEPPAPPRKQAPPTGKPAQKRPHQAPPKQSVSKQGTKRSPNQIYNEMAILTHKIDERRRVVDSNGHSTLYDEYFELVFETRRGETIRLVASRAAFKEVPRQIHPLQVSGRHRQRRDPAGTPETVSLPPVPRCRGFSFFKNYLQTCFLVV